VTDGRALGTTTPVPAESMPTDPQRPPAARPLSTKLFLASLGLVAVAFLAAIAYRSSVPRQDEPLQTGDLAVDAKAYLAARSQPQLRAQPQAQPLEPSTADRPATGNSQPLLGKMAPDFELPDDQGKKWSLRDLRRDGPVIVVFYYGYHCPHCVAQLFALERDLAKFTGQGVRLVALSPDPVSETAEKFLRYGRFHFPVLSDPDNHVAQQYGAYTPATAGHDDDLKHATFLVDRSGRIDWAYTGNDPFVDNEFLLKLVASKPGAVGTTTAQPKSTVTMRSGSRSSGGR
jgi:thioredoxin-dependent peroxiredoxin